MVVAGSGLDYVSARELALKVEEGSGLPATALQTETVRHGHLAAASSLIAEANAITALPTGLISRRCKPPAFRRSMC